MRMRYDEPLQICHVPCCGDEWDEARAADGPTLPAPKAKPPSQGLVIQAGSFKTKENADKASTLLGPIAPVDVAPVEVGGEVYFRVRVGPFADEGAAQSALSRVTQAGYQGAKIVLRN